MCYESWCVTALLYCWLQYILWVGWLCYLREAPLMAYSIQLLGNQKKNTICCSRMHNRQQSQRCNFCDWIYRDMILTLSKPILITREHCDIGLWSPHPKPELGSSPSLECEDRVQQQWLDWNRWLDIPLVPPVTAVTHSGSAGSDYSSLQRSKENGLNSLKNQRRFKLALPYSDHIPQAFSTHPTQKRALEDQG